MGLFESLWMNKTRPISEVVDEKKTPMPEVVLNKSRPISEVVDEKKRPMTEVVEE